MPNEPQPAAQPAPQPVPAPAPVSQPAGQPQPPSPPSPPTEPGKPAPAPEEIRKGSDDPFIRKILKDIGKLVEPPEAKKVGEPPAKAADKPPEAPTKPPEEAAKPPEPADKPKPKVKKAKPIDEVVDESVKKALAASKPKETAPAPAASPQAGAPVKPAVDPDADYVNQLGQDEQETLKLAEYAEQKHGKQGLRKQFVEFFKKVDAYVSKVQTEDPERTLDESDQQFQQFLQDNRPDVDSAEWNRIDRERIIEEAVQRGRREAISEVQPKLDETERRQKVLEVRPVIERAIGELADTMIEELAASKDANVARLAAIAKDQGWEEAEKASKLFSRRIQTRFNDAIDAASEYLALMNGVVDLDLEKNEKHIWIANFIKNQGEFFEQKGGEMRVRQFPDGLTREFRSRGHLAQLCKEDPEAPNKYWTLNDADVCALLRANARILAENDAAALAKELSDSGYMPVPPPPPAESGKPTPPAPPPQPTSSPKAISNPAPGIADGTVSFPTALTQKELLALGIPVPGRTN